MRKNRAVVSTLTRNFLLAAVVVLNLSGCLPAQIYPTLQERGISLQPGDLEAYGISYITPSAATGQEEERQAIALVFADVMTKERSAIRVVPLAETLSAVNQAGLADEYSHMYRDYRDTGLLNREVLRKVGEVTGMRYVAQIKVQSFAQTGKDRLSVFGLRLIETKTADVRLFFQIWDSREGVVAWEAAQEVHFAQDTMTEQQLTLNEVVRRAAQELIAKLP